MTSQTIYLKDMPQPELLDLLFERRKLAAAYRGEGGHYELWADHHEGVVAAIEAEIARRARERSVSA